MKCYLCTALAQAPTIEAAFFVGFGTGYGTGRMSPVASINRHTLCERHGRTLTEALELLRARERGSCAP